MGLKCGAREQRKWEELPSLLVDGKLKAKDDGKLKAKDEERSSWKFSKLLVYITARGVS